MRSTAVWRSISGSPQAGSARPSAPKRAMRRPARRGDGGEVALVAQLDQQRLGRSCRITASATMRRRSAQAASRSDARVAAARRTTHRADAEIARRARPHSRAAREPLQPRRKRATARSFSASETIRPAPPSRQRHAAGRPQHDLRGAAADQRRRRRRRAASGRPCRCASARGAAQDTHGSRTNVSNEVHLVLHRGDDLLLAARARAVVLGRAAVVLARAGERERLLAVQLVLPAAQAQRVAAVAACRR